MNLSFRHLIELINITGLGGPEYKTVYNEQGVRAVEILNYEALKHFGGGARWSYLNKMWSKKDPLPDPYWLIPKARQVATAVDYIKRRGGHLYVFTGEGCRFLVRSEKATRGRLRTSQGTIGTGLLVIINDAGREISYGSVISRHPELEDAFNSVLAWGPASQGILSPWKPYLETSAYHALSKVPEETIENYAPYFTSHILDLLRDQQVRYAVNSAFGVDNSHARARGGPIEFSDGKISFSTASGKGILDIIQYVAVRFGGIQ